MRIDMKRIYSLAVLLLVLALPVFAQQNDLQPVAIVRLTRSEPITQKQLRIEVERYEQQAGRALSLAERRQVLDVMINERLLMQAAERDRIVVTDNEVNQQLQQLRTQLAGTLGRQPTEAEFATAVRNDTGLEMPAFRDQIKKQLLIQKYMTEKKGGSFNDYQVPTEEEIRNSYQLVRSQLVRPDTVRFSIISVPFTDAASKIRARASIDDIAAQIGGSAIRFMDYRTRGEAPNAGFNSGDGGFLPRNPQAMQVVGQEFMNVAFSLNLMEVSRVIENVNGYQIIMVTEIYPQKTLELDDIFQLGSNITVREYIGRAMLQERQEALLQRLQQEIVTDLRRGTPYQIMEAYLNW